MGKSLTNEKDVQSTQKSFQNESKILKFDENSKTPIYLLSADYEEGFVHWIESPDGRRMRVVCGGGIEGKGFDPSNCKICNHLVEGYREARQLEGEDKKEAEKMRKGLNRMRANYSAEFLAVKGELLRIKDKATGKKSLSADFDEYEVGILALTETQFNELVGLKGSEQYPFMKTYGDLVNRVIILDKRKRSKSGKEAKYATIEFQPLKAQSDVPEIEYDADEYDLSKDFELDEERIDKAFELLSGGEYDEEVDDEIEYEDEDGEAEVEDGEEIIEDEDDAEDDTDEENDISDIDEEVEDDDFEDDLPWEGEDEEEKAPPKATKKKTAAKRKTAPKTTAKKSTASRTKKTTTKKTTRRKK